MQQIVGKAKEGIVAVLETIEGLVPKAPEASEGDKPAGARRLSGAWLGVRGGAKGDAGTGAKPTTDKEDEIPPAPFLGDLAEPSSKDTVSTVAETSAESLETDIPPAEPAREEGAATLESHALTDLRGAETDVTSSGFKSSRQLYMLCVMRHSARLDIEVEELGRAGGHGRGELGDERKEKLGSEANDDDVGVPSIQMESRVKELLSQWPDRRRRPYDTPISDFDLPTRAAASLLRSGALTFPSEGAAMEPSAVGISIIASPFRRCLLTAGVVARALGVAVVDVNLRLGERMDKVRQDCKAAGANATMSLDGSASTSEEDGNTVAFSYLTSGEMQEALGTGVTLGRVVGEQPPITETAAEAKQRSEVELTKIANGEDELGYSSIDTCTKESADERQPMRPVPESHDTPQHIVLVVAHGDTLGAAAEALCNAILYEADYCGWLAINVPERMVAAAEGVQIMSLDDTF